MGELAAQLAGGEAEARPARGPEQGRNREDDEHRDDGEGDEQIDQGESARATHGQRPPGTPGGREGAGGRRDRPARFSSGVQRVDSLFAGRGTRTFSERVVAPLVAT